MNDNTLNYYNKNADAFISSTVSVDFSQAQNIFLTKLSGKKILDFGCGSGRDTKYFLEKGYDVDAIDGSIEICKSASEYTGIEVEHMLFQELSADSTYDGIWACASILHLPKDELESVFEKIVKALVSGGIIYASFKYGEYEGNRNGRYFTDFTIDTFRDFVSDIKDVAIDDYWITGDVREGRGDEKWLNVIMKKTSF